MTACRDRIVGVFQVADLAGVEGAGLGAGRIIAFDDAVVAEGALVGNVFNRVEEADSVRAAHNAVAAADAPGSIDQDNAICCLVGCTDRADLHAGWGRAVIAELWHKKGLGDLILRDQRHA